MAVTVLMHMKEGPSCPHDHLRNAIDYILDVKHGGEKTRHGDLVGGNSGLDHKEILDNFLATKRDFGKLDGRQGYHFVISFAKGETDEATAYEVVREFCEAYLSNAYDYVFAIHTDKEHLHGHIVFNSVDRLEGYKYHYKNGDWKRDIQPVTDRICEAHGLAPLTFSEDTVGVSYASWAAEHAGRINWTHIIRADVDYAISRAGSFQDFQETLEKMGYQLRMGYSRKRQESYITFVFTDPEGKEHKRRSYHLPAGYSPSKITERIRTKEGARSYEELTSRSAGLAADHLQPGILKGTQTHKRLYQAVTYYKLPNPYAVPAYRVRKDMMRLERLIEECRYMKENRLTKPEQLSARAEDVEKQLRVCVDRRKQLYGICDMAGEEEKELLARYHVLQRKLPRAGQGWDSHSEETEDEMARIAAGLPHELVEAEGKLMDCKKKIQDLMGEKRILERILDSEQGKAAPEPKRQKKAGL